MLHDSMHKYYCNSSYEHKSSAPQPFLESPHFCCLKALTRAIPVFLCFQFILFSAVVPWVLCQLIRDWRAPLCISHQGVNTPPRYAREFSHFTRSLEMVEHLPHSPSLDLTHKHQYGARGYWTLIPFAPLVNQRTCPKWCTRIRTYALASLFCLHMHTKWLDK